MKVPRVQSGGTAQSVQW